MIKKLEDQLMIDMNGDCWGKRLPEIREIVDKVNEIIEYIDKQEEIKR